MLLSSNLFSGPKTTKVIHDLRDLEKVHYFYFKGVRYFHRLTELENINQFNTKFKQFTITLPTATCSCNSFTKTDLIIDNFCIHLQKKILTILRDRLLDLSYLLLKDFKLNTHNFKAELNNNYFIILSFFPKKFYVKIYFKNKYNIFKALKYFPLKKQFEYGIKLELDNDKNDFIESVLNKIEII